MYAGQWRSGPMIRSMPARRLIPCHNAIAACLVVSSSLAHALTRIQRRADQQGCRSQRGREQNEQRSDPDQLHALSSCSRRRILLVLQLTYAARRLARPIHETEVPGLLGGDAFSVM